MTFDDHILITAPDEVRAMPLSERMDLLREFAKRIGVKGESCGVDTNRLRELAEAATAGPWKWRIEDVSMATLHGLGGLGYSSGHVMTVSPCRSCLEHADKEADADWKFGRCMTPKQRDADYIAAANPSTILALLDRLERAEAEEVRLRRRLIDELEEKLFDPSEAEAISLKYQDLLYQVETKFPGETRHETAKRLIGESQHVNTGSGQAASERTEDGE